MVVISAPHVALFMVLYEKKKKSCFDVKIPMTLFLLGTSISRVT